MVSKRPKETKVLTPMACSCLMIQRFGHFQSGIFKFSLLEHLATLRQLNASNKLCLDNFQRQSRRLSSSLHTQKNKNRLNNHQETIKKLTSSLNSLSHLSPPPDLQTFELKRPDSSSVFENKTMKLRISELSDDLFGPRPNHIFGFSQRRELLNLLAVLVDNVKAPTLEPNG